MIEPEGDPAKELSKALFDVARTGTNNVFKLAESESKETRRKIEHLKDVVRALRPEQWEEEDIEVMAKALDSVVREAVGRLPDDEFMPKTKLLWRQTAEAVFSISALDVGHLGGRDYDNVIANIYERAGLENYESKTRQRLVSEALRVRLAFIILDMVSKKREAEELRQALLQKSKADEYVGRPEYDQWLLDQYISSRLVILYGDAGTGKTTLAERFARALVPDTSKVVTTRCTDQHDFDNDLQLYLQSWGIPARDINLGNKLALLAELTKESDAPPVLILDDVQDYGLVGTLAGERKTTVICTSVIRPPVEYIDRAKEVNDLEDHQALRLIRETHPPCPEEDAVRLAKILGNRVLAIHDACGLLRAADISPSRLIVWLERDLATQLDRNARAAGNRRRVLTKIYELILHELRSPESLDILRTFLCLSQSSVHKDDLALCHSYATEPTELRIPQEYGRMRHNPKIVAFNPEMLLYPSSDSIDLVEIAVRHLQQFSLVRIHGNVVSMHNLTKDILAEMNKRVVFSSSTKLCGLGYRLIKNDNWTGGHILSHRLIQWINYLWRAVNTLQDITIGVGRERLSTEQRALALTFVATIVSARIQGLLQFGTKEKLEAEIEAGKKLLFHTAELCRSSELSDSIFKNGLDEALSSLTRSIKVVTILSQYPACDPESLSLGIGMEDERHEAFIRMSRFINDTEWDPLPYSENIDSVRKTVHWHTSRMEQTATVTALNIRESALITMGMSSYFFHQAQWEESATLLLQALAWFESVGGDVTCSNGYIQSCYGLSRVNLRRGDFATARLWIDRIIDFQDKSYATTPHYERLFGSYDSLLQIRVSMQELELTLSQLCIYGAGGRDKFNRAAEALGSRLEEVQRLYERTLPMRILPELAELTSRVQLIYPNIADKIDMSWFARTEPHWVDDFQRLFDQFHADSIKLLFHFNYKLDDRRLVLGDDGIERAERCMPAIAERLTRFIDMAAGDAGLPYWHARAVTLLLALGIWESKPASWIEETTERFVAAATRIGRQDWIACMNQFKAHTRSALWMLSY